MRIRPQRVRSRSTQRPHCGVQSVRDCLQIIWEQVRIGVQSQRRRAVLVEHIGQSIQV